MVLLIKHYFKSLLEIKKILILLFILYLVFSKLSSFSGMVASIVLPIIIVCYLTNKIENKEDEKFLNTLPINKEDIVISKYLFVFITTLGMIILTYLASLIKGSLVMIFGFDSVYTPFISLIITMSIYLPFRFSKKVRLPKISSYILSVYLAYFLIERGLIHRGYQYRNGIDNNFILNSIEKIYKKVTGLISLTGTDYFKNILNNYYSIGMLGALVIFVISMVISIKVYRRKEFI